MNSIASTSNTDGKNNFYFLGLIPNFECHCSFQKRHCNFTFKQNRTRKFTKCPRGKARISLEKWKKEGQHGNFGNYSRKKSKGILRFDRRIAYSPQNTSQFLIENFLPYENEESNGIRISEGTMKDKVCLSNLSHLHPKVCLNLSGVLKANVNDDDDNISLMSTGSCSEGEIEQGDKNSPFHFFGDICERAMEMKRPGEKGTPP